MTSPSSQQPTGRRSWANVVHNKVSRFTKKKVMRKLDVQDKQDRSSLVEAYRTIRKLGLILGARTISRSRNPRALLIEVRYVNDEHLDAAVNTSVTYDNSTYRATRAISIDADITNVNFSHLPFLPENVIRDALNETMSQYGRVCQIRLYVESETETFEGEATVILDRVTPAEAMQSDNGSYYRPLTRFIHIDAWDEIFPTSWKNASPVCRYCRTEDLLLYYPQPPSNVTAFIPAAVVSKVFTPLSQTAFTALSLYYNTRSLAHSSATTKRSSRCYYQCLLYFIVSSYLQQLALIHTDHNGWDAIPAIKYTAIQVIFICLGCDGRKMTKKGLTSSRMEKRAYQQRLHGCLQPTLWI
ncbi:predicted protein [Lichtheimia corymbifera JMRC:FSU:9682]|nr:predicted protein [Lichtheimia corymbifera JMRC:FSU:9682]